MSGAVSPRVLVVDDEDLVRRVIVRELSRLVDVVEAANGTEALAVLDRDPRFAAVLTDLDMLPGPSGLDVLKRTRIRCPTAARILLSGRATEQELERELRAGLVQRFVEKPWPTKELLRILEEVLRDAPPETVEVQLDAPAGVPAMERMGWKLCLNHGLVGESALKVLEESVRRVAAHPGTVRAPAVWLVATTHEVARELSLRHEAGG